MSFALKLVFAFAPAWAVIPRFSFRLHEPATEVSRAELERALTALGGSELRLTAGFANGFVDLPAHRLSEARRLPAIRDVERVSLFATSPDATPAGKYVIRYQGTPERWINRLSLLGVAEFEVRSDQNLVAVSLPLGIAEAVRRWVGIRSFGADTRVSGCGPLLE